MSIQSLIKSTAVQRAGRTFVQAVVAEVALAGSGYIPSTPTAATKEGVVALAVSAVTLVHNLLDAWRASSKAQKLAALQVAIEAAATQLVADRSAINTQIQVPTQAP